MMYLFLLSGNAINLAACPIRRLELCRIGEFTVSVTAWFADGSSERLASFTHEHSIEMAKELISLIVTESLDRAHRGIGALYLDGLIGLAESAWSGEMTGEETLRMAA